MQTQPNNYSCGVYAVVNALSAVGENLNPVEVAEYTQTTRAGTSETGIINALRMYGYQTHEYRTKQPINAWKWVLHNSIQHPLILLVEKWEHWVVIAGRIKNKVMLIDSDPKNSVAVVGKQELLERWGYRGYYGIKIK